MTMRWRSAATASCGCARGGSKARALDDNECDCARFEPNSAVAEVRLQRLHDRTGAGLLALLWADQLPVFLRRSTVSDADRIVARQPLSDLDVRGRYPGAAGAVGAGLRSELLRCAAARHDRLHVQARELAVPARAVAVSRLAAVSAGVSGLAPRL